MTGEEITVSVGQNGSATIDADSGSFVTQSSFGIVLESHAKPAHVHCRLDGDLAHIARLDRSNYYVEPHEETYVPVIVRPVDEVVSGTLELSTGYGAASVVVDVTVEAGPPSVDVDEALARPPQKPDQATEPTLEARIRESLVGASGLDAGTLGVLVLALLAIVLAASTAAVVGGPVAILAFLVVVVGVVVATVLLVR